MRAGVPAAFYVLIRVGAFVLPLLALLPLHLAAVLSQTQAIIASILVVIVVIVAWKFLKFAFRIALIVVAAIAIFLALRWAGVL